MRPLIAFLILSTSTLAGPVLPTWIEGVDIENDGFGTQTVYQNYVQYPDVYGWGVMAMYDPRSNGAGSNYLTLIDFQGTTQPPSLYVTFAEWPGNVQFAVPLYVTAFPASATPPTLTEPPELNYFQRVDIPPGDYRSNPLEIPLTGTGDVCYLLYTEDAVSFGGASIIGTLGPAPVPEPASIVLTMIGLLGLFTYLKGTAR